MADFQLTDVIETNIWDDIKPDLDLRLLALWNSGVVARDPIFDRYAQSESRSADMIFWRDLDMATEPNYSSDQPVDAVPAKTNQDTQTAYKVHLNNGWSSYQLTRELTRGTDPMQHVKNRTSKFWLVHWQERLIAQARGVMNANINGNFASGVPGSAGDMVIDVSINDGDAASAANKFSRTVFSSAVFTMGDRSEELGVLVVHSTVMATMESLDDIEYVFERDQKTRYPTYRGRRVVVDDNTPFYAAPSTGFKYVSLVFGPEAFGYGEGSPAKPIEVINVPRTGHGGGSEELWLRKTWLMHPYGHDNLNAVKTGNANSQKLVDLLDESNWERTVPRKAVPIAFIITNG